MKSCNNAAMTASGGLIELARRNWIVLFFNASDDQGIDEKIVIDKYLGVITSLTCFD